MPPSEKVPRLRVSLVVPLRNEASSLRVLIASIGHQTRHPDEVLLVDGGSTDDTALVARSLTAHDPRFRVIEAGAATPGRGRNVGIAAATHDWIALTDAGIQLDPSWLERLLQVAEEQPQLDVVYGNYEPLEESFFEHCAALAYVAPKQFRQGELMRAPSVASMMLRRQVWQAVGGFPDWRAAEDLVFMERIEQQGCNTGWAPHATVRWQLQPTLLRTYSKFAMYSKHNVWAARQRDWHYGIVRMYLIAMPFAILAILHSWYWLLIPLGGLLLRTARSIHRRLHLGSLGLFNPLRLILVGAILVTIDLATFAGWVAAARQSPGQRVTSQPQHHAG